LADRDDEMIQPNFPQLPSENECVIINEGATETMELEVQSDSDSCLKSQTIAECHDGTLFFEFTCIVCDFSVQYAPHRT